VENAPARRPRFPPSHSPYHQQKTVKYVPSRLLKNSDFH
jgi:hypothetical protein